MRIVIIGLMAMLVGCTGTIKDPVIVKTNGDSVTVKSWGEKGVLNPYEVVATYCLNRGKRASKKYKLTMIGWDWNHTVWTCI